MTDYENQDKTAQTVESHKDISEKESRSLASLAEVDEKLPNLEICPVTELVAEQPDDDSWKIEKAKEDERILLEFVSRNLSSQIYRRANEAIDGAQIHESIGVFPRTAGIVAAKADIDVCKMVKSEAIGFASTINGVNQKIFQEQLRMLFEAALHGQNPSRQIPITLLLSNGKTLTGKITIELFTDVQMRSHLLRSDLLP